MSEKLLFSSYQLGSISLKNRVVMAPMTRSRSIGNVPGPIVATYYSQRAEAGLIITEGTSPSVNGLGYARIPGLFNQAQVAGWKLTTDAVHKAGSRIFVQLMHTGRVGAQQNIPAGGVIMGPSAIAAPGQIGQRLQRAELDYLVSSRAAATALAENYVGLPFEA